MLSREDDSLDRRWHCSTGLCSSFFIPAAHRLRAQPAKSQRYPETVRASPYLFLSAPIFDTHLKGFVTANHNDHALQKVD